MSIQFTDIVNKLPASVPFVGPEAQERSINQLFKARIGANESVFGPSEKAISAMKKHLSEVWMYGDPENFNLKHALAKKHKVNFENIVVGEGIDGLLGYLVRLIIEKGDNVVTTDGAYPTFNYHVEGFGGNLHKVPFSNDTEDLQNLLNKVKLKAHQKHNFLNKLMKNKKVNYIKINIYPDGGISRIRTFGKAE